MPTNSRLLLANSSQTQSVIVVPVHAGPNTNVTTASTKNQAPVPLQNSRPEFGLGTLSSFLVVVSAIITAWVAIRASNKSFAAAERALWQKTNDEELSRLENSLNEFYGPFLHISKASLFLSQDLRSRMPDKNYRMLLSLMTQGWYEGLSVGDQIIVKEVCDNGARQEKLISDSAGAVDESLFEYLGRAAIHFRMLNRAFNKELGYDPTNFQIYVFPEYLTKVMEKKVQEIKNRCDYLRSHPAEPPPKAQPFIIPHQWAPTPWPNPERI